MLSRRYSSIEAARELGISDRNVRRKASLHGIGQRVGRTWAFTSGDVARLGRLPTNGGRPPAQGTRRAKAVRGRSGRLVARRGSA